MHTRSCSVYRSVSPMKNPVLRMLWWERVAPLGKPVVPEVYWMLIGSSNCSVASSSCSSPGSSGLLEAPRRQPASGVVAVGDELAGRGGGGLLGDQQRLEMGEASGGGSRVPEARLAYELLVGGRVDLAWLIPVHLPP